MKKVAAYIRVSTDGQVGEDKFGLEAQREIIEEYCRKNEMLIEKWYTDEGESGAKERPGFDEIVYGEASNPPFEAVIVAKSDRVARDIKIYYYYKMMLSKKDIELISVAEDFGQFGVFADMLEAFTLCVAKMERENINKRTSGGRKIKAAKGGYSGGRPPYGYISQNKKLVIVPEEAEVVRYIFNERDNGAIYRDIVNSLIDRGIKNRQGNYFTLTTIKSMIDNRKTYEGMYRYGESGEWIKGEHEAILKSE